MPDESMKNEQSVPLNEEQLTSFSGELDFEDLEFLSDQQAEMMAGGGFTLNLPPNFEGNNLPGGLNNKQPPGWDNPNVPWNR